jgi:hypothetical protein
LDPKDPLDPKDQPGQQATQAKLGFKVPRVTLAKWEQLVMPVHRDLPVRRVTPGRLANRGHRGT